MQYSTILGIESSCDDTAAAVWQNGKILANIVATQKIHEQYGGVIPELASRAHQSHVIPVVDQALRKAQLNLNQLDAIAVTLGPGLMGSLHVGVNFAKGLAMAAQLPLVGVNHLNAHLASVFIEHPKPQFPLLCLLVSGGHTQIILAENHTQFKVVGHTIDDAAGEAFDKAAKLLGLPYPGGPLIDYWAKQGNSQAFAFPYAKVADLNYSFSGLKTSFLYFLREELKSNPEFIQQRLPDICASYQFHVVDYLLRKLVVAIKQFGPRSIALSGGVSANSTLRNELTKLGEKFHLPVLIPSFEYCTDNAAMIAVAGHYMLENGELMQWDALPFAR